MLKTLPLSFVVMDRKAGEEHAVTYGCSLPDNPHYTLAPTQNRGRRRFVQESRLEGFTVIRSDSAVLSYGVEAFRWMTCRAMPNRSGNQKSLST